MKIKDFFNRVRFFNSYKTRAKSIDKSDVTVLDITELIETGNIYEDSGEYILAADCYKKAADLGSSPAMHFMGNLFLYNKLEAKSTVVLGIMPWHVNESGIPDYESAFIWFLKAAENDFPLSMINVGNLYYYGKGTPRDEDKSRFWLERAMKHGQDRAFATFYSLFGEKRHISPSDQQYDHYLNKFKNKISVGDITECDRIMEKLMLGTDKQFYKMGMMLAMGFCSQNNLYNRYNFAQFKSKQVYAPVYPILSDEWATTFIVNIDAFDQEFPIIGFAININCQLVPRKGLEIIDVVERKGEAFGWLPEQRTYTLMQVNRNSELQTINTQDFYNQTFKMQPLKKHDEIVDYSKENTAFFFANPKKEYSIEVIYINPQGEFIPILRYSDLLVLMD